MHVVLIYGTRPEAVKIASVAQQLRAAGQQVTIVCTGQHTDLLADAMRDPATALAVRPDQLLAIPSDGHVEQYVIRCKTALRAAIRKLDPDAVLVQGDTASAYAGSEAAHEQGYPVGHIEAGVRSGDPAAPWPEERFRVAIDRIARWHWCPTVQAQQNLADEGILGGVVTGNPGIDHLLAQPPVGPRGPGDTVLVTLHRREAGVEDFQAALTTLGHWCRVLDWTALCVTHPNGKMARALAGVSERRLIPLPPLGLRTFRWMLYRAGAVLTDSGGVQEEACALGVPCLVARDVTDRPESVVAGYARLVGTGGAGGAGIGHGMEWAEKQGWMPDSTIYGDGTAGKRIVRDLLDVVP